MSNYIMDHVKLFQNDEISIKSIVVKGNKVDSIHNSVNQLRMMKQNLDNFIMSPITTTVFNELNLPAKLSLYEQHVLKGIGVILIPVTIAYEYRLTSRLEEIRKLMKVSPLDYLLAIKVSQKIVSPKLMQRCKKERIPAVFVEITDLDELTQLPWSWIRQYSFPFNPTFIPIFRLETAIEKAKEIWSKIMIDAKLSHSKEPLIEGAPIANQTLKKIGLYPIKGYLRNNGELSYNLFHSSHIASDFNGISEGEYDKLIVTMLKGKVVRAGTRISLSETEGSEIKIKIPGFLI
ncbi:hypothetical protein [Bacillus cihuensis]|uniref:hypothetical protein n=1 Tax=Bacillus cihuensis TaxID=1208599 RepID=UPI00040145DC|nr:hypothetical protein [Bacillus cihuensis]